MDHPYFTVTVTSLTRGWSYTTTEGETTDPLDDVLLTDPLTYEWSFKGELVPGQLETSTAQVSFAGKSADVLPDVQVGDLITIDVRVGTAGSRIIAPPPFRAAEPVVTLGGKGTYPARMKIPLSDLSVDWRSRTLGSPLGQSPSASGGDKRDARPYWRERGAEMAVIASGGGLSIGCPTWWADFEGPVSVAGPGGITMTDPSGRPNFALAYTPYGSRMYEGNLVDLLEAFINTHQPSGYTHSWATVYDAAGHPTGYRRIGPDTWASPTTSAVPSGGALSDPAGPLRVEAVPASRKIPGSVGLPLQFDVVGGILELEPKTLAGGTYYATQVGLDAAWCIIPATARRARDSVCNLLNLFGFGYQPTSTTDGSGNPTYAIGEYAKVYTTAADIAARGVLARDLPTMLQLGASDGSSGGTLFYAYLAAAAVAANFLSDSSALEASWSYDGFTVISSLIPQDVADWLLPVMAPRLPAETNGDGRLVRHVTIYDLEGDLRFDGQPVTGFVTAGQMVIEGGDILWSLRTAPGRPVFTGFTPTPVTVGDVQSAGYGTTTTPNIDPLIRVADLELID